MEKKERPLRGYLAPDILLRLLINKEDRKYSERMLERAKAGEFELMTSLFALFEAVASIEESDAFDVKMLVRILESVTIETEIEVDMRPGYEAFNDARKRRLRQAALKQEGGE